MLLLLLLLQLSLLSLLVAHSLLGKILVSLDVLCHLQLSSHLSINLRLQFAHYEVLAEPLAPDPAPSLQVRVL